jgi:tripartite-type tricarboxylate transporter receptor subunit TctC
MIAGKIAALAAGALVAVAAHAQSWPQKPVKFLVPFPAGGATDIPARLVAEKLSAQWGQPVIVDNRPGAGGTLGAAEGARAAPDGYTLLFPSGTVMTASQYIYAKLNYDPERDFVPITVVVSGPQVLAVNAKSPYRTVQDLIDAARANPGKLTFGHAGVGSQTHLAAENFVNAAKINALAVPYKGDPPALTDLVAGSITFRVTNLSSTIGHVTAGRLRALGVTSTEEAPQLPGVPPIAKTLPGFENSGWFGLVAPAGTPAEIVQKVYRDTKRALDDTQVKARFYALGAAPVGNSPEEMAKMMADERARWSVIVKQRNIRLN